MPYFYVQNAISIEDVTELAQAVGDAHTGGGSKSLKEGVVKENMEGLLSEKQSDLTLPEERPYLPACDETVLRSLAMLPGDEALQVRDIGRGQAGGGTKQEHKR